MMHSFWGVPPLREDAGRRLRENMDARQASSDAREAQSATENIERRLDKLAMISMAMWQLASEKTGLTDEDLFERVRTIDLMDGVIDGKVKRQLAKCVGCDRTMSPRHTKCIYCGAERLELTAFDDVV